MKQGSTDDPFAEAPGTAEESSERDGDSEDGAPATGEPGSGGSDDGAAAAERSATERRDTGEPKRSTADDSPSGTGSEGQGLASRESPEQRQSLPYIHARDGVKDGRTQRPVFLRDHVEAGIDDLVAEMEAELGEDVYKTDVTEAAMAVAQENPDLVLGKLEEWGYGWT